MVASLAAATDAIRAQGDAEVQLGAAELRAVVAAAVGAAKKIGGVEALANRERRLRRELASIARAARDGAFGAGGADLAAALADLAGGVDEDERRSGRSEKDREDGREEGSPTGKRLERSEGFAAPELAAATRRAVDVARTAHESAHARRVRLDAELSRSVSGASAPAPAPVDPTRPPRRSGPSEPRRRRSRARAPTPTSSAASLARGYSTPNRFANGNPPSYEPPKTPCRRNPIDWPRASPSSETNWPGRSERRRTPRRGRGSPRRNARSLRRRTARFAAL